jgi:hypothetical protein
MGLDELNGDVRDVYGDLGDELAVGLDRETRNELAMLSAVLGVPADELVRRAVHTLFRRVVDTGDLDFHLRRRYDVSYDEYLYGSLDGSGGRGTSGLDRDDDRRYQQ